jgi:alanyl-tRNA synthetase/REP element-mobilizing transposase RayT
LHLDTPSPDAGLTVQGQGAVPDSAQSAPGTSFSKRNLPHFEKPWAIYHVILNTMAPRKLSPAGRDIVFDCLLHWRESRYRLVAACVMPDHTHLIIQPGVKEEDKDGNPVFWPLSEILHSIKSYSAKEVNKLDNVKGSLWQEERYDRYMRSDADLREKFQYVCGNPWAAGLVRDNEPWPWLWTPEIEAWKPYVPLAARKGGIGDGKGSTGDSPVRVGDPPPRMGEVHDSESNAGLQASAPSHSAGLVAQRHGQVARATQEQIQSDIAFRVIADHIRTLSFAIADGIQPGNNDRNYVLRRILRRAVRYGRTLGFHEPFFYKLVDVLADTMGDVFPEIRSKKKHVQDVIRTEEEAFNRTLDTGTVRLDGRCAELVATSLQQTGGDAWKLELEILSELNDGGWDAVEAYARKKKLAWTAKDVLPVSAEAAFELYDTYGFPLDLTELMARERGLTVDVEGFSKLMEEQRARARAAQKKEVISVSQIETTTPTKFVGFDMLETSAKVVEVVSVKDKTAVILDTSACYAEMGGQVGDTGELTGSGQLWRITNTQKSGNTWLHFIQEGVEQATSLSRPATGRTERKGTSVSDSGAGLQASVAPIPVGGSPTGTGESPVLPVPGSSVTLSVDAPRRNAIQRHHTVTHLLHWALHEVVSKDASQKGSFVGPEKLTFDFNSAPLTPQQVADIEKLVNERIVENAGVSWTEVSYADVKSRKDVMQFFGDKYGDVVRVVQISGRAGELNGYSMELCGGTHTRATGEIGLFRIVGESAIAAGMRRIEAIAGLQAYRKANDELQLIRTLAGKVNSPVHELENKIEALLTHQKELEKEVKIAMQRNASNAASELLERIQTVNGIPLITHNLGDANGEFLQAIADALKGRFKGIVVLGGAANDAVAMVATVSPDFTAKIQAGKIIQQIAPIVGGKGGGKPDNARGGGKDASKLDEALVKVKTLLG